MKENKIYKKANLLIVLGILFLISSIGYFAYSKSRVMDRKKEIEKGKIHFIRKAKKEDLKEKEIKDDKILVENLNNLEILENEKRNNKDDKFIISNEIGYIEIKKIGIILPIFLGTGIEELKNGVGLLESTDKLTNKKNTVSVLAGHRGGYNGDQTFLNINKLRVGDKIKIITKENIFTYKVLGQEIIESTDWSRFTKEENKTKLILMSCHPYPENYQRLLVISELIESEELK